MSSNYAVSRRLLAAGFGAALACGLAFGTEPDSSAKSAQPTVAFVCAHGSIKSLMAAERFNRLAAQRGLAVRAISRATNEKTVDSKIPDPIVRAMTQEGYQVADVKPQVLTREEASDAARVVHISLEGPVDFVKDPNAASASDRAVERWNGIPSGLTQYDATRRMIAARVDALIDEFAKKQASVATK